MKKKKNVMYRKSVSLLAAAAMTAVLMTGQAYPVTAWGQNTETTLETSSLIPDNITIDQPIALSEVTLPKSDYGTLSWVDTSFVPNKRVQSCEVVFKPAEDVDLSYLSGWDADKKVVKGKITVVVSSIEGEGEAVSSEQTPAEDFLSGTDTVTKDDSSQNDASDKNADAPSEDQKTENIKENTANSGKENTDTEDSSSADESETAADKEEISQDTVTGSAEDISSDAENVTVGTEAPDESSDESQTENDTASSDQKAEADTRDDTEADNSPSAADSTETVDPLEGTGKLNENFGAAMPGATVLDGSDEADESEEKSTEVEETEGDQKNIFDNPLDFSVADSRPDTAEDNLTEEKQAARAAENHSCEGISVSGIDLPWYVQFQVTSGDSYEFKNEEKATIFQSYEFKLWNLKNNTEYEIPDGQYVSVTIPVKEGYEYSIEHLLDNGATETIVPSVNGSTMIFSTHSFSPFGIAGFRPIVGEDIANGAYGDGGTPTPTPTQTISGTPTPSPSVTGTGTNGTAGTVGNGTGTSNGTSGNGTGNSDNSDTESSSGTTNGTSGTTTGSAENGTGSSITNGTSGSGTSGTGTSAGTSQGTTRTDGTSANGTENSSNGTSGGQTAGTTTGSNGQNQTSSAVKTGDNTVILPFVILVIAAAAVIIIVIIVRKKKK